MSCIWALKVKHAARLRPADLRSVKRFAQDYPEATVRLACLGGGRLSIHGVLCLSAGELPRAIVAGTVLPRRRHGRPAAAGRKACLPTPLMLSCAVIRSQDATWRAIRARSGRGYQWLPNCSARQGGCSALRFRPITGISGRGCATGTG